MWKLFIRRVIWLPVVVWVVASLTFLALRIVPGNPIESLQNQVMDQSQLADVRAQWGLDEPVYRQYAAFMKDFVQADMGLSMSSGVPINRLLFERVPPTMELAFVALIISTVLGVLAGVISVVVKQRWIDNLVRTTAVLGLSLPVFWVGILLIIVFGVELGWMPTSGRINPRLDYEVITNFMLVDHIITRNWDALGSYLKHLILPATAIGLTSTGFVARITRSSMLEQIRSDYIRTARAKGIYESAVIWRHAFPNAVLPIITLQGVQFGSLLGGAVITETVFAYPGLGRLLLEGILDRDYAVVQASVIIVALAYVLMNLIVDLLYVVIDPRVRRL